jgi:DNA-binding XRE family transcriptional regulator
VNLLPSIYRTSLLNWYGAAMLPRSNDGRTGSLPRKPSIGCHLRDARMKRGLSVVEVAEQVGVSIASVYLWETDRSRPRNANLSALCKVWMLPVSATREMAAVG